MDDIEPPGSPEGPTGPDEPVKPGAPGGRRTRKTRRARSARKSFGGISDSALQSVHKNFKTREAVPFLSDMPGGDRERDGFLN